MSINLIPGDVFLTRGRTAWSRLIRRIQRHPKEEVSVINHAGGVATPGNLKTALAIESDIKVKKHSLYSEYAGTGESVIIARPRITDLQRNEIVKIWEKMVGDRYGWFELPMHGIDALLSRMARREVVWARKACNSKYSVLCSGLVAVAFDEICGWRFCGKAPTVCQPDDIWDDWFDLKRGHPDRWKIIMPLALIKKD
jgi:hypothetical protein